MQKLRIWRESVTARLLSLLDGGRHHKPVRGSLVDSLGVANIKSQIKRNRQNERRHERNKAVRSSLKTSSKHARAAAQSGDAQAASASLREASRALDKAASSGALHKRTAARRKSRLARAAAGAKAPEAAVSAEG